MHSLQVDLKPNRNQVCKWVLNFGNIAQLQIFWGNKPMTDVVIETNKLC